MRTLMKVAAAAAVFSLIESDDWHAASSCHSFISRSRLRPTIAGINKTMRARAVLSCAVYHVRHSAMNVPPDPVISDCRGRYCADYAWSSIAQVNFGNMVRSKRRNGERVPSIIRIILIEVVSELMKKRNPFRESRGLRERKKRGIGLHVRFNDNLQQVSWWRYCCFNFNYLFVMSVVATKVASTLNIFLVAILYNVIERL